MAVHSGQVLELAKEDKMKVRRSWSILLALLLVVGGVLTVGFLSLDVLSNLTGSIPPQLCESRTRVIEESAYGTLPEPTPINESREQGLPWATVLLQAERLNPNKGTISGTSTITLPEELEKRIFDGARKIFGALYVVVTRSPSVKRFVYLIAAIPFALIAVLVHLLFFSSRQGDPQEASTFLVEMVAAMLAILPLREVIVPGDVEGLTRVDLILGFALVLIVSLALTKFSLNLLSRETPAAAPELRREAEEAKPTEGGLP